MCNICFVDTMNSAIISFIFATSSAWSQVIADLEPSSCGKEQWNCRDGTCISIDDICDGVRSCPDGSDETFTLCRRVQCQANWFRCAYGACADGPATCDNVQDCADNSDELLRRCRNQTEEVRGIFKCGDGREIAAYFHCDGTRDCTDGSDEILEECAGKTCASDMFQCAYGACVQLGSDCDDKEDCADGSDESDELCSRLGPITSVTTPNVSQSSGPCILPPYPPNGHYSVSVNVPGAVPGQGLFAVALNIICNAGYAQTGAKERLCVAGLWQPTEVTNNECARNTSICRLHKDPSVRFRCFTPGNFENLRECNEYVPDGTLVAPACNTPNYFHNGNLPYMRCINGLWDYVAHCQAECGRVVPSGIVVDEGGRKAELGEVPWHAGIYQKTREPFQQICGGSLVSSKVVISAAHCFRNDVTDKQPASNYAVALGKLHRPWDDEEDTDVQRSDVEDIKITLYFRDIHVPATNFQHDIAVLRLVTVIEFKPHIRPVCIDFSVVFENRQLSPGNKGKAAVWDQAGIIKVVELPYISTQECYNEVPDRVRQFLAPDKFCAGFKNGTAVCAGDSGGGLAFPDIEVGRLRYYLRGIISIAPTKGANGEFTNRKCSSWLVLFTMISSHEKFILENL